MTDQMGELRSALNRRQLQDLYLTGHDEIWRPYLCEQEPRVLATGAHWDMSAASYEHALGTLGHGATLDICGVPWGQATPDLERDFFEQLYRHALYELPLDLDRDLFSEHFDVYCETGDVRALHVDFHACCYEPADDEPLCGLHLFYRAHTWSSLARVAHDLILALSLEYESDPNDAMRAWGDAWTLYNVLAHIDHDFYLEHLPARSRSMYGQHITYRATHARLEARGRYGHALVYVLGQRCQSGRWYALASFFGRGIERRSERLFESQHALWHQLALWMCSGPGYADRYAPPMRAPRLRAM